MDDLEDTSPSGKTLRSSVEVGRYLEENPEYIEQDVKLSHFSFATPKLLQEASGKMHISEGHGLPELAKVARVALARRNSIHGECIGPALPVDVVWIFASIVLPPIGSVPATFSFRLRINPCLSSPSGSLPPATYSVRFWPFRI
ncbi:hypothetical protein EJB05_26997, partial [Eragrostis curvula]